MTDTEDLTTFVKEALTRGVPRAEIEDILLRAGWSMKQVSGALASFADSTFPIPVPKPRSYTDAREVFLYGLMFVALSLSAYHLGLLIFRFIEQAFPLAGSEASLREATRWPIAALVVALPVFFYVSLLVNRDSRLDPSRLSRAPWPRTRGGRCRARGVDRRRGRATRAVSVTPPAPAPAARP